jgi:hypothetical protein
MLNKNGYIHITGLCNYIIREIGSKKPFNNWKDNRQSQEIMNGVSEETGIPMKETGIPMKGLIIIIRSGPNKFRGSYVHGALVTSIISWCSPKFSGTISCWVEEWKKYTGNNARYWSAIRECAPVLSDNRESIVQYKLFNELGGQIEVPVKFGIIDLLTDTLIIEIKTYKKWMHALGQVIAYGTVYPNHSMIICLLDKQDNADIQLIKNICSPYNVSVIIRD